MLKFVFFLSVIDIFSFNFAESCWTMSKASTTFPQQVRPFYSQRGSKFFVLFWYCMGVFAILFPERQ